MFNVPLLPRPRLTELIDRATRHKVVLVCGPAGAGKTVACAQWAAASSGDKRVAWLTLRADEDRAWFWADLAGRLRQARLMPREAAAYLEEASADGFPFRLVEMARRLTAPLVLVLDNAHALDDRAVVAGLDVLIRHAPPTLCVLLAGRHAPGIRLDRLRASGELATVGAADLACTPDEADSYLAMAGAGFPRPDRDELSVREKFFIGELRPAAMYGAARRAGTGRRCAGQRRAAGLGPGAAPPTRGEARRPRTCDVSVRVAHADNPPRAGTPGGCHVQAKAPAAARSRGRGWRVYRRQERCAAASGSSNSRRSEQDERLDDLEQQQAPAAPAPAASAGATPSMADQLSQLATLHDQGALTDDEFAAAKARILGG